MRTESQTTSVGEHLFDEQLQLTNIADYGLSWGDLVSGATPLPGQGAFFELKFDGTVSGPRLHGHLVGVDYMEVRADGKFNLHIHGTITTDDGERIAVAEDGVLYRPKDESGMAQFRLTMRFGTGSPKYAWLNQAQVWCIGQANWNTGEVTARAFLS